MKRYHILLVGCVTLFSAHSAHCEGIPPDLIEQENGFVETGFKMSPDGSKLVSFSAWNPSIHLHLQSTELAGDPKGSNGYVNLYDLDKLELVWRVRASLQPYRKEVCWIDDHRFLVDGSSTGIWLFDTRERTAKNILPLHRILMVPPAPARSIVAVRWERSYLYERINLDDLSKEKLARSWEGKTRYKADSAGRLALRQKNENKTISLEYNPKGSEEWVELENVIASSSELDFSFSGVELLDVGFNILHLGSDGSLVYSTNAHSDRYQLYRTQLGDDTPPIMEIADEQFDVCPPFEYGRQHLFTDSEGRLSHIDFHTDMPKRYWFSKRWQHLQAEIDAGQPHTVNTILQIAEDVERVLVRSSNDIWNPFYSIYNQKTGTFTLFGEANEALQAYSLNRTQPFSFASSDGRTVHGYITLPSGEHTSPPPCILLVHGGPWARDYWTLDRQVRFFSSHGYAVARINYRGSIGYGRSFLLEGVKQYDGKMVDDLVSGIDHLAANGWVDRSKVVLMGGSFGGYLSLMTAARHPTFAKAVVSGAAPTDIRLLSKEGAKWSKNQVVSLSDFMKTHFGHPSHDREYLERISPINHAASIECPVFLYHGERDTIVPLAHFKRMRDALKKAGVDVESYRYALAGHGVYHTKYGAENAGRILDFLERALAH